MLNFIRLFSFVILFLFIVFPLFANRELFEGKLNSTYNFKLAKASKKLINKKYKEIKKFWSLVDSNKKIYLPLLREKLKDFNQNNFFLYNGSSLLIKHSKTKKDLQIAADAIGHFVFPYANNTVYFTEYFKAVHWLGVKGANTWIAVNNILNYPKFSVFLYIPRMGLVQEQASTYCLLVQDEKNYMDNLIKRLQTEKNDQAISTIIFAISFIVNAKGDKAIIDYLSMASKRIKKRYKEWLLRKRKKIKPSDPKFKIVIKKYFEDMPNYITEKYKKWLLKKGKKTKLYGNKLKTKRKNLYKALNLILNNRYTSKDIDVFLYMEEAPYHIRKRDYKKLKELRKEQAKKINKEAMSKIAYLTELIIIAHQSKI